MEKKGKEGEEGRANEGVHLWHQATQLIWCGDAILLMIAVSPWCLDGPVLRALGWVCLRKSEGMGEGPTLLQGQDADIGTRGLAGFVLFSCPSHVTLGESQRLSGLWCLGMEGVEPSMALSSLQSLLARWAQSSRTSCLRI